MTVPTFSNEFTSAHFRKELTRLMPGYQWTVHKSTNENRLEATGIQSSGFNRLSTLSVVRSVHGQGVVTYSAKSAGYGRRARWLHANTDITLASALRGLQNFYEAQAGLFRKHASSLERGRTAQGGDE
ncbi:MULTISPECIES: hypothetical protein [Brucella]|uniref:Uncharacterized protein n=1 Tax=Brucella intermedia M86 TaxID=1234597 RepID=M5JRC2_9HYPH|nr:MULTISPECIES: hypothetical protein [Brucella]ELT50258.1 hypothetical protein D584_04918 [Brucella intermedia M86]KAB2682984.1 hypothetical protein F9K78_08580 [Brucella pseudintermedia]QNQ40986.1 hypothetical protein IAR37_03925 [Brucella intermedia]